MPRKQKLPLRLCADDRMRQAVAPRDEHFGVERE
jgi:hypothetical protein